MTENERLTNSDKEIPTLNDNAEYWLQVYFKLKDYETIGTIEEFKALKEKSVAKKAIRRTGMCYAKAKDGTDNYEIIEECPTCKKRLCAVSFNVGYCKCGQKITV